jgi:site-specific DNA recombinase
MTTHQCEFTIELRRATRELCKTLPFLANNSKNLWYKVFEHLISASDLTDCAVTQQFNTTTSMGRLTLNVLLSFAQFERELSAERVRDKVAASRRKGKWTGGTVPLGYDAKNKKLVINKLEAETVRTIFRLYLELKSFGRLVTELDRRGIVTKRRDTKVAKYNGGIPFTYGPLAYFLKNRVYVGETHHRGKWFKGEHEPIIDRQTFERVQALLKLNTVKRRTKFSESGALLQGKLFDDKGNRMGPSFSSKNGVRYRFYVSTALRGRGHKAGSVARVAAPEIEGIVEKALRVQLPDQDDLKEMLDHVEQITLKENSVEMAFAIGGFAKAIKVPWNQVTPSAASVLAPPPVSNGMSNQKLLQAVVRAHVWLKDITSSRYQSVEDLANAAGLHPKIVRQGLRLAFLSPSMTSAILEADQRIELKQIPKRLPLLWREHQRLLD